MTDCLNREGLLKEINVILKDEYIANISIKDEALIIDFLNGQKFKMELTEI